MDVGLVVVVVLAGFLFAGIRIANENERFAMYAMGRFAGFKGPGLVMKMPGGGTAFVRVALGADGDVQSNELVVVAGHAMPYASKGSVRVGAKIRIVGFTPTAVQVEASQQFVVCAKCGHKNVL